MKRKFLSVLTALAITVSLSACQSTPSTELIDSVVSEATTVETTTSSTQNRFETTYEITEWSADDFQSIECCGIDISLPCKLSDIDERFEVKISRANEEFSSSKDWFELYFENEYVGALCYNIDDYNIKDDYLTYLSLETFNINGLDETSTKETIQKVLGTGNAIDFEYADSYFTEDMMIIFNYINDKTTISIGVYEEN